MKKVLHIEMPRALTAGVREFDVRTCLQLELSQVFFSQADLNSRFWKFIFRKYAPEFEASICNIFESEKPDTHDYLDVANGLIRIDQHLMPLDLNIKTSGLFPREESVLSCSQDIREILHGPKRELIDDFFEQADTDYCFGNFDLISIGITGKNSLLVSFGFAAYLQSRYPDTKLCVGKHHYENFSFLFTLDKILQAKTLFHTFPYIGLYEEKMGDMILGILSEDQNKFTNLVWLSEDNIYVRQPERNILPFKNLTDGCKRALQRYISDLGIAPCNIHYNMQLVGNQCYYSRCTFCAQINKHLDKNIYDERESIALSISVIEVLRNNDIVHFSFIDEALRPADLLILVKIIEQKRLRIIWNMRLIANTRLTPDLIDKLHASGCREVLFGLETIDPEMAGLLGKVSSGDEISDLNNMVFACTQKGISVVLSMIYGFPGFTETKEHDLIAYAGSMLIHNPFVLFIFNRFELFGGTMMYRSPERYGISFVETHSFRNDLNNSYKFEPACLSEKAELSFRILNLHPCVNATEVIMNKNVNDLHQIFMHFRYASFGFTSQNTNKLDIYRALTSEYARV